jgi:hypothetical protein
MKRKLRWATGSIGTLLVLGLVFLAGVWHTPATLAQQADTLNVTLMIEECGGLSHHVNPVELRQKVEEAVNALIALQREVLSDAGLRIVLRGAFFGSSISLLDMDAGYTDVVGKEDNELDLYLLTRNNPDLNLAYNFRAFTQNCDTSIKTGVDYLQAYTQAKAQGIISPNQANVRGIVVWVTTAQGYADNFTGTFAETDQKSKALWQQAILDGMQYDMAALILYDGFYTPGENATVRPAWQALTNNRSYLVNQKHFDWESTYRTKPKLSETFAPTLQGIIIDKMMRDLSLCDKATCLPHTHDATSNGRSVFTSVGIFNESLKLFNATGDKITLGIEGVVDSFSQPCGVVDGICYQINTPRANAQYRMGWTYRSSDLKRQNLVTTAFTSANGVPLRFEGGTLLMKLTPLYKPEDYASFFVLKDANSNPTTQLYQYDPNALDIVLPRAEEAARTLPQGWSASWRACDAFNPQNCTPEIALDGQTLAWRGLPYVQEVRFNPKFYLRLRANNEQFSALASLDYTLIPVGVQHVCNPRVQPLQVMAHEKATFAISFVSQNNLLPADVVARLRGRFSAYYDSSASGRVPFAVADFGYQSSFLQAENTETVTANLDFVRLDGITTNIVKQTCAFDRLTPTEAYNGLTLHSPIRANIKANGLWFRVDSVEVQRVISDNGGVSSSSFFATWSMDNSNTCNSLDNNTNEPNQAVVIQTGYLSIPAEKLINVIDSGAFLCVQMTADGVTILKGAILLQN